ncbi:MAG: hypothetical protein Q8O43_04865 [Dehalococcoidia bacterium]|nr:hypothetical protein [Dehalococcoidia bacterium]
MTEGAPREPEKRDYRRDEKEEEKRQEKEEKTRNEKNWDEKWRRDPINAICWAAVFIWAGLGLLAETTGWGPNTFNWWVTWAVILAGAGVIFILCAFIRLLMPEHRRPVAGNVILGFILLGVGLGKLTDWGFSIIGAVVLIGIGVIILLGGIFRRSR